MRSALRDGVAVATVLLMVAACNGVPSEPVWSGSFGGATVSLRFVPDGFSHVRTEERPGQQPGQGAADVVAVYHTFANENGSVEFAVAWQEPRFPWLGPGHREARDGRDIWIGSSERHNGVIWEEQCTGILVESRGPDSDALVDIDVLWRIAQHLIYQPDEPVACPEYPEPFTGDWEFFAEVQSVRFTGDFVVDLPWYRWRLGPMEITLTTGEVLEIPEGSNRGSWCRGIDPEVWVREDDGCWIAGALDEQGLVSGWMTFKPGSGNRFDPGFVDEIVDGAVIIRGYPIPIAEDVRVDLRCCPDQWTGMEDMTSPLVQFDAGSQEIVHMGCACRA